MLKTVGKTIKESHLFSFIRPLFITRARDETEKQTEYSRYH